jgi:hypothetical protein
MEMKLNSKAPWFVSPEKDPPKTPLEVPVLLPKVEEIDYNYLAALEGYELDELARNLPFEYRRSTTVDPATGTIMAIGDDRFRMRILRKIKNWQKTTGRDLKACSKWEWK